MIEKHFTFHPIKSAGMIVDNNLSIDLLLQMCGLWLPPTLATLPTLALATEQGGAGGARTPHKGVHVGSKLCGGHDG